MAFMAPSRWRVILKVLLAAIGGGAEAAAETPSPASGVSSAGICLVTADSRFITGITAAAKTVPITATMPSC